MNLFLKMAIVQIQSLVQNNCSWRDLFHMFKLNFEIIWQMMINDIFNSMMYQEQLKANKVRFDLPQFKTKVIQKTRNNKEFIDKEHKTFEAPKNYANVHGENQFRSYISVSILDIKFIIDYNLQKDLNKPILIIISSWVKTNLFIWKCMQKQIIFF